MATKRTRTRRPVRKPATPKIGTRRPVKRPAGKIVSKEPFLGCPKCKSTGHGGLYAKAPRGRGTYRGHVSRQDPRTGMGGSLLLVEVPEYEGGYEGEADLPVKLGCNDCGHEWKITPGIARHIKYGS
jgi:hypothetical protein